MSYNQDSDIIIKQSEIAFKFIQKVEPLILHKWLVPTNREMLLKTDWDGIIPPDYLYWITKYGSGGIELVFGRIDIPCIQELSDGDGRFYSEDDPAEIWKRLYLDWGGAHSVRAIDMTIVDDSGCCPVIKTGDLNNHVESVLGSSWPMYIVGEIINSIKKRCRGGIIDRH